MTNRINLILEKYPCIYYKIKYIRHFMKVKKINRYSIEDKKAYLNKIYYKINNYDINWDNRKSHTEKIQKEKLFSKNNNIKAKLTDKYEVRNWIKEVVGEEYLIPLIGVYDSFEEIDIDKLPRSFVIKCNHDSGSVTIVYDKNKVNWKELKYKYDYHMKIDFSYLTLESHYSLIKPKIIIEELITDNVNDLPDYKFWCFNSKVYFCRVDVDRFGQHKRNIYDLDWNLQDWTEGHYQRKTNIKKPKNFDEMIAIAQKLCQGFQEVRVDLYNLNGKIYFGEMSFSSASGFEYIDPEYDLMLGSLW